VRLGAGVVRVYGPGVGRETEQINRAMLRVRDAIDRDYATELDVATLAAVAHVSPDHLIRAFRGVFGETPHRYLQRRRVERAMFLLRTTDAPVLEICLAVGFGSLGTFGRTFTAVVGESPTRHRARGPLPSAPGCFTMAWTRPSEHVPVSEKPQAAGPT
jgi:AraC-like DNA-binding protein